MAQREYQIVSRTVSKGVVTHVAVNVPVEDVAAYARSRKWRPYIMEKGEKSRVTGKRAPSKKLFVQAQGNRIVGGVEDLPAT